MNTSQLVIQTALTFVAAGLGAIIGALLARRNEQFKHVQELRAAAYADFLRGFAKACRAQLDGSGDSRREEELEGRMLLADSRSRIAIYGSPGVLRSLAKFTNHGTQTETPEGMRSFAELCSLMRGHDGAKSVVSVDDIETVLFGVERDGDTSIVHRTHP